MSNILLDAIFFHIEIANTCMERIITKQSIKKINSKDRLLLRQHLSVLIANSQSIIREIEKGAN
jgi:hypothetical protein